MIQDLRLARGDSYRNFTADDVRNSDLVILVNETVATQCSPLAEGTTPDVI